jgi:hypothetical protein
VVGYAYPFGDYGQNYTNDPQLFPAVSPQIVSGIYSLAFYQDAPGEYYEDTYASDPSKAPYFIKRIEVHQDMTGDELVDMLEKSAAKSLPYTDTFTSDKGWLSSWGSYSIDPSAGTMTLKPAAKDTGASVVLDGSYPWTDYAFSADVSSPTHTSVYLWARFQDGYNNAGCNFGSDFVHVEETLNGVNRVIQGVNQAGVLPSGTFKAGVEVSGRTISCLINGTVVAQSQFLDASLDKGGVGFKAWDKQPDLASLVVYDMNAAPLADDTEGSASSSPSVNP